MKGTDNFTDSPSPPEDVSPREDLTPWTAKAVGPHIEVPGPQQHSVIDVTPESPSFVPPATSACFLNIYGACVWWSLAGSAGFPGV